MAIAPVSSVNNNAHCNVYFGQRAHKNDSAQSQEPKIAGKMVTIPLATLMALMPLADGTSKGGAAAQTRAPEQTELLAQNTGSSVPYHSLHLGANYDVKRVERFKFAGKMQSLVYCTRRHRDKDAPNTIHDIFVIPDGYSDAGDGLAIPPKVRRLRYHDIGQNEYCGIVVYSDAPKGSGAEYFVQEYKLPDDIANRLVTFLARKDSKLINGTLIKFESTTSPKRFIPYYLDFYGNKIE